MKKSCKSRVKAPNGGHHVKTLRVHVTRAARGFTLIELLVVIAIIGLLATLSVIALSNARAKSRDAKRLADVKQMQTSLEMYYTETSHYPSVGEFNSGAISYYSPNIGTTTYMNIIPAAPTPNDGPCSANGNGYVYTPNADKSSYTISFCIGNPSNSLAAGPKCATPGGIGNIDCSGLGGGGSSFTCGAASVTVTTVAGHACNTGAPDYDTCAYDVVSIGNQCWLAQNLNIGTIVTGTTTQTNNSPTPVLEKYCYGNITSNCQTQGGLYQWDEAMQYSTTEGAQGICPTGWHIPSDAEQNTLDQYLTDNGQICTAGRSQAWDCTTAGTKLKPGGTSGFNGLFAGLRLPGSFWGQSVYADFWSSSVSGTSAWSRDLDSGITTTGVWRQVFDRTFGLSVRCLKD